MGNKFREYGREDLFLRLRSVSRAPHKKGSAWIDSIINAMDCSYLLATLPPLHFSEKNRVRAHDKSRHGERRRSSQRQHCYERCLGTLGQRHCFANKYKL
eukprot:c18038_g1_i2.p1 GENE.c18038_g1_i2~~c18038_g1_i2.p1  ORF type:complete len:100 (+),score=3.91 c18038_g1_i2:3-302(+)